MAGFFSNSNSLQTEVGQIIERAINPYEPEPNLELFFEITDLINLREENAKDGFKAIRKELNLYKGKNWAVVKKILILLETCSNNCNRKFQICLANKDFLQELKIMIGPKHQPPLEIQEKVLYLIQHWNNMFRNDSEFKNLEVFYTDLRAKGVDFPVNDTSLSFDKIIEPSIEKFNQTLKIKNEPVTTSSKLSDVNLTIRETSPTPAFKPQTNQMNHSPPASNLFASSKKPTGVIKLNDEQIAKLNSELNVVESNVQVFNEILTEVQSKPSKNFQLTNDSEDLILLRELNKTCREMQTRITQLIGNISNEAIINELLRINDDLNNVFLRYGRFENSGKIDPISFADKSQTGHYTKPPTEEKPLIDFSDFGSAVDSKLTPSKNVNRSESPDHLSFVEDENEIREMENWLRSQEGSEKKA